MIGKLKQGLAANAAARAGRVAGRAQRAGARVINPKARAVGGWAKRQTVEKSKAAWGAASGAYGSGNVLGLGAVKQGFMGAGGAIKGAHDQVIKRRAALSGLTGKAREQASEAFGNPYQGVSDFLWGVPAGAAKWISAGDLGPTATTGQRWIAGGTRAIGGYAAADFLNPFSPGWND